jgi:hypothetical protein
MAESLKVEVDEFGKICDASLAFLELTEYELSELLDQKIDCYFFKS